MAPCQRARGQRGLAPSGCRCRGAVITVGLGRPGPSALLPPSSRRSQRREARLPGLDLPGVSPGEFSAAFQALVGPDAPGLSPATLRRLHQRWQEARTQWHQRALAGKRSVYGWGAGVYVATRLEAARHGLRVIRGADATGPTARVGLWE